MLLRSLSFAIVSRKKRNQHASTSRKALKRLCRAKGIDNIINIFIYESGGVKIMSLMSPRHPFSSSNRLQSNTSSFRFLVRLCSSPFLLSQQVFAARRRKDFSSSFQLTYGSIFAHNKILRLHFTRRIKVYWFWKLTFNQIMVAGGHIVASDIVTVKKMSAVGRWMRMERFSLIIFNVPKFNFLQWSQVNANKSKQLLKVVNYL